MATTLALWFLPFLLFFFMNGHAIVASRDLKVELQEKKEVESVASTPTSSGEANQAGYNAAYKSTTHGANQAGYTGYSVAYKSPAHETNQAGYEFAYKSPAHGARANQAGYGDSYNLAYKSPVHGVGANQAAYEFAYKSPAHGAEANQAGYGDSYNLAYKSPAHGAGANQAGYGNSYNLAYKSPAHGAGENQAAYEFAYKSPAHGARANQAGYGNSYNLAYKSPVHGVGANQAAYEFAYKSPAHGAEANQAGYGDSYNLAYKSPAHGAGANQAGYGNSYNLAYKSPAHGVGENQAGYQFAYKSPAHGAGANQAGYGNLYNLAYKSPAHDSNNYDESYKTQHGSNGPQKDDNKPYATQYGVQDSKQDSKESTQDYAANYKKKQEESIRVPPSNVDHTEAFMKGMFTLDDLYVGNVMTLQFPVQELPHFLPRKEADSIPFSTSQLSSVLQLFSISEDSPLAHSMRYTLEQCEAETLTGETKICANSLESMLDFVSTIIGSKAKYDLLTTSHPTPSAVPMQKYTILEVSKDFYAPKYVACHPLSYPYAVYYCHFIATGSKVFKVLLSGEDGDKMDALGICHLDTSEWSPDQNVFRMLGIKPGGPPACHFFPVKHLVWVPQPSTATM